MGFFSRQEYWSGLPCSPPGDLPDPGIKPGSLTFPALAGRFFTTVPPGNRATLNVCSCIRVPTCQGRNLGGTTPLSAGWVWGLPTGTRPPAAPSHTPCHSAQLCCCLPVMRISWGESRGGSLLLPTPCTHPGIPRPLPPGSEGASRCLPAWQPGSVHGGWAPPSLALQGNWALGQEGAQDPQP